MAGVTKAALSAALALLITDGVTDQFRRDVMLLPLLGVVPGQGENCTWTVKGSGRNTAAAHAEGDDAESGDYSTHTRLRGTLSWAEYWAHAKVSGLSMAVAANGGYANGGLLMEEITDAIDELAVKLGEHCYSGNHGATPPELAGAARAIDSSDDNFAGIDTGDNTWWAAGENTVASLANVTINDIRTKVFRPVKDATGRLPEFVTTTGTVFDVLASKIDEKSTVNIVRTVGAGQDIDIAAQFGQRAIAIDGVPIIEDRHCTALTMYAWHSRFVKISQLRSPVDQGVTTAEIQAAIKMLTGVDVPLNQIEARIRALNNSPGLVPNVEALAKTGDSRKIMITVKAQMKWFRRNAFAKLTFSGA